MSKMIGSVCRHPAGSTYARAIGPTYSQCLQQSDHSCALTATPAAPNPHHWSIPQAKQSVNRAHRPRYRSYPTSADGKHLRPAAILVGLQHLPAPISWAWCVTSPSDTTQLYRYGLRATSPHPIRTYIPTPSCPAQPLAPPDQYSAPPRPFPPSQELGASIPIRIAPYLPNTSRDHTPHHPRTPPDPTPAPTSTVTAASMATSPNCPIQA